MPLLFFLIAPLSALASPHSLDQRIKDAALRSALDPSLIKAVIQIESNFESRATSPKGAQGLMQLMPQTAQSQGMRHPFHVTENLMAGCDYLRQLINKYRGNLELALAAYNAGPRNVEKFKGVPPFPETRHYVKKVLKTYQKIKSRSALP